MPDDPIRPPDLVGAGIAQPPQDPSTLMGLLRSQGSLPVEALALLGPTPNPVQAYASALAGGVAQMRGLPNPVASQQAQQQQQQLQQTALIQRAQEHRQKLALQQNEASRTVLHDILFGPNALEDSATRTVLSKQYAKAIEPLIGSPIPEGAITAWSRGGPKQTSQKEIAQALAAADTVEDPRLKAQLDQQAQTLYRAHGGAPEEWQATRSLLRSPVYLKSVGLPTSNELAIQHNTAESGKVDVWVKRHPQFRDTDTLKNVAGHADEFTRKFFGRSLYSLDETAPDDAAMLVSARAYAEAMGEKARGTEETRALRTKQAESDIVLEREKRLTEFKATHQPKKFSLTEAKRALDPLDKAETAMSEFRAIAAAVERAVDKRFIPPDPTQFARAPAAFRRWFNSNDPDLLVIRQLTAPATIGLVDRFLNDEKGTRAMQMFHEQIRIVSDLPTKAGYDRLLSIYNYLFFRIASKQVRLLERAGTKVDPDVLAEAQTRFKETFPTPIPDPTAAIGGPLATGGRATLTSEQFRLLKTQGYTEDQIREKYEVPK